MALDSGSNRRHMIMLVFPWTSAVHQSGMDRQFSLCQGTGSQLLVKGCWFIRTPPVKSMGVYV